MEHCIDQLALFAMIPPGQILFASDTPYGRAVAAAALVLRVGLATGLARDQLGAVAGGQLARLVAGVRLLDRHAAFLATDPSRHSPRVPGIHLIFVAAAVARTPGVPLPDPASR